MLFLCQMRSTSNFNITSIWNTPRTIELTPARPPTPGAVALDDFNVTNISITREPSVLVIIVKMELSEPDVLNGNLTLFQVFIGLEPFTGFEEPPPQYVFGINVSTTKCYCKE